MWICWLFIHQFLDIRLYSLLNYYEQSHDEHLCTSPVWTCFQFSRAYTQENDCWVTLLLLCCFSELFDIMCIFQTYLSRKPFFFFFSQKASRMNLGKSYLAQPPHFGETEAQKGSAPCQHHTGSERCSHYRNSKDA